MKTNQEKLSQKRNETKALETSGSSTANAVKQNEITNSKNATNMKAKSNPATRPVSVSKKSVSSKPVAKSIKREAAEKAKLTIVKSSQEGREGEMKGSDDSVKSLKNTLRIVDDLSRKVKLRGAIIDTLDAVEAFSFKQESNEGGYNGCCVQFMDDNRNKWEIRDLEILIHLVDEAKAKCRGKLEDIEKSIRLPKTAA